MSCAHARSSRTSVCSSSVLSLHPAEGFSLERVTSLSCVQSVTVVVRVASACPFHLLALVSLCIVPRTRGSIAYVSCMLSIWLFFRSTDLGAPSLTGGGRGKRNSTGVTGKGGPADPASKGEEQGTAD